MNILLLTSEMDEGGAETHVRGLAEALVRRGYGVTVASAGGRLASELGREGVSHMTLPLNRKDPFSLAKCYFGLRRAVKERNFRIVHAHSRIAALVASWVCAGKKGRNICFVTTIHAHFREDRLLHRLSRWGRGVIAVSDDLRMYLLTHSRDVLAENVAVIPNGIDTEVFTPSESKGGKSIRIVFLSRLDSDCSMAAQALCGVAERLCRKYCHAEIVIGGGGGEYDKIKRLADSVNDRMGKETVRMAGRIDDVRAFLADADVFVGVSRAALEAMSCAVPVVLAGNEGFLGIAEGDTLERGEATNFCCRGCGALSEDRLFGALEKMLDRSAEEREALGRWLREYVVLRHSADRVAERTERFYKEMMSGVRLGTGGVLLCGYYGFGNMGDDLLLTSAVKRAGEKFPRMPVVALTSGGWRDSRKFGIVCVRRSDPFSVMSAINKAEVVVFGGGTLLQNSTSRRSLWYYLFILRYAKRKGKRVELWGNGIGEIFGERARRMTASALSRCDYLGMRERESAILARELMVEYGMRMPYMELEADLAMGHPPTGGRGDYILSRLGVSSDARTAVIALRGIEKRGYMASLEKWISALVCEGIKPVFIAMYPTEDMEVSRRICRNVGGVLAYPVSAADAVSLMKHSCMVCGMRYHALVLAQLSGTPFIGFGGESKIRSFCRSHGGIYYTDLLIFREMKRV
ncbi:MAG: polysaccharide pyruvyl transferase family protein [Clostridia bacterium]|nr:polysaccharide pyruvyl transferase family protein [Clostridia bacterium]